jgi:hypothetical protein
MESSKAQELASLQKTRQTLTKFLECLRSIKSDLNVTINNFTELKNVNKECAVTIESALNSK